MPYTQNIYLQLLLLRLYVCLFLGKISMFLNTYLMYLKQKYLYFSGKGLDRHKYFDADFLRDNFLNVILSLILLLFYGLKNFHQNN